MRDVLNVTVTARQSASQNSSIVWKTSLPALKLL
jgi:hypothetical protein